MKPNLALVLVSDQEKPAPLASTPQIRGYCVEYRIGETNRCPGCSATAWIMGRFSAECARCQIALPIALGGGIS